MRDIIESDSLALLARAKMIDVVSAERDIYKQKYESQIQMTNTEKKEKKRWRRRTLGAVLVGGLILFVSLNQ